MEAKIKKLYIESPFTDTLDMSYGKFDEVTVVGLYNLVDATEAEIDLLNMEKAEAVTLDKTDAKITEIKKGIIHYIRE